MKDLKMRSTLVWVGGARKEYAELPSRVQDEFGFGLYLAEIGSKATSAKVLKGFGNAGVLELRDNLAGEAYRAVYTVQFEGTVYVLAAFHKKAKSGIDLPQHEKELLRKRLSQAELLHKRRAR